MSSASTFSDRKFDGGGPTLADVGESELLERLVTRASAAHGPDADSAVIVGAGDDAAIWRPSAGRDLVVTQDAIVEGEDFTREWSTPYQAGHRLLASSLSDLAGMGAVPSFCTATVCAPEHTQVDDVIAIQAGVLELGGAHGCRLVGGDVSRTVGPIVLDLVAAGTVAPGACLRRDRGTPGDSLITTGAFGGAAAGLHVLRQGRGRPTAAETAFVAAQLWPRPRVLEGTTMVAAGVRCGGDVSDGLLVDAERTARASGCAAELWSDAVPVHPGLRECYPDEWMEFALGGGEDFELICAVSPGRVEGLIAAWPADLAPLTVVGRLTGGTGIRLLDRHNGTDMTMPSVHSRHFA